MSENNKAESNMNSERDIFDGKNINENMPEDEIVEAYLKQLDMDTPDLWDKIEAGIDEEIKSEDNKYKEAYNGQDEPSTYNVKSKKRSKLVYIIPTLAIAAIIAAVILVSPLMEERSHIENSENSDTMDNLVNESYEDYVDESADSDMAESVEESAEVDMAESAENDAYMDADMSVDEDDEDTDAAQAEASVNEDEDISCDTILAENVTLYIVEVREGIYICKITESKDDLDVSLTDSDEIRVTFTDLNESLEAGTEVVADISYYDDGTSSWVAKIK